MSTSVRHECNNHVKFLNINVSQRRAPLRGIMNVVGGGGVTRVYPKVSGLSHNEIYAYNNKHSLRWNMKVYGGKTH
jgi:hypothetical protein